MIGLKYRKEELFQRTPWLTLASRWQLQQSPFSIHNNPSISLSKERVTKLFCFQHMRKNLSSVTITFKSEPRSILNSYMDLANVFLLISGLKTENGLCLRDSKDLLSIKAKGRTLMAITLSIFWEKRITSSISTISGAQMPWTSLRNQGKANIF